VLLAEVVVVMVVFTVECGDEVLSTDVVLAVVFNVEYVDEVLFTEDVVVVLCLRDSAIAAKTTSTRNIKKRESNMLKNKTLGSKS
jgi:hypothetical protein